MAERRVIPLFNADALAGSICNSSCEHWQLRPGPFYGELMQRSVGQCMLSSGCYSRTLFARGNLPKDAIVIGTILAAKEAGCINGFRFGPRDLICFPPLAELDYVIPAETHWVMLQIPVGILAALGPLPRVVTSTGVVPATLPGVSGVVRRLYNLVPGPPALTAARASEQCAGEYGQALSDRLTEGFRDGLLTIDTELARPTVRIPQRSGSAARMLLLRRFQTLARARCSGPVRIPELCAELGVKQRTLEKIFKDHIGVSPHAYLQLVRLHEVRRQLLRGAAQRERIADIAARFGLYQPGRFATSYRRFFGELPSETACSACTLAPSRN